MTIESRLAQLTSAARGRQTTTPPPPPAHIHAIGAVPAGIAPRLGEPGAALHDVLAHVQQHVPTVTGLAIRDGMLLVAYAEPPDDATRAAARAAISDEAALARLASRSADPAAPAQSGDLRAALLDDKLSDTEWLRAFRSYQVALLSEQRDKGGV